MGNKIWSIQPGFSSLSEQAQEIAEYADKNDGSVAGAIENKPSLLGYLDEFHQWSAIRVSDVSHKTESSNTVHSLKKRLSQ